MDTLCSQNVNKTVGKQVMTRTVSFCSKFDDLPLHGQCIGVKVLGRRVKPVVTKPQSPLTSTNEEVRFKTEVVKSLDYGMLSLNLLLGPKPYMYTLQL